LNDLHNSSMHHHDVRSQNVLMKGDGSIRLVDFHLAVDSDSCQLGSECPDHRLCPPITLHGFDSQ